MWLQTQCSCRIIAMGGSDALKLGPFSFSQLPNFPKGKYVAHVSIKRSMLISWLVVSIGLAFVVHLWLPVL